MSFLFGFRFVQGHPHPVHGYLQSLKFPGHPSYFRFAAEPYLLFGPVHFLLILFGQSLQLRLFLPNLLPLRLDFVPDLFPLILKICFLGLQPLLNFHSRVKLLLPGSLVLNLFKKGRT